MFVLVPLGVIALIIELANGDSIRLLNRQHQQKMLPSWESNESLANMVSSYEMRTFGFPTITPLNSTQMDVGFKGSKSFENTDPVAWARLFEKLNTNLQVNVHVFGGSTTGGNGCKGRKKAHYIDAKKKCAWQFR
jgi:hypothetical protein